MRRPYRWLKKQTHVRPFLSALFVLILIVVPGYYRVETIANDSHRAAVSASETAQKLATNTLANCQTRNIATKRGRDRFDTFFTAIEVIFTTSPTQTEAQKAAGKKFVDDLRAKVPLDPAAEDVDCNGDGVLTPIDYGQ